MRFKRSLGYLIHHLAQILDTNCDHMLLAKFGIGLSQFRVLLVLEEADGATQKHIADELSQTEASISRQIKILSKKGLIETETSHVSGREKLVFQTIHGHEIASQATKLLNEYHKPIFESMSESDQRSLQSLLQEIIDQAESRRHKADR